MKKRSTTALALLLTILTILSLSTAAFSVMGAAALEKPAAISVQNLTEGINVKWSEVKGADGYVLYKTTGDNTTDIITTAKGGKNVSYIDTSVKSGETGSYTVEAYKGEQKSIMSDKAVFKYLSAPVLSLVYNTVSGIKISWKKTIGATAYYVYRRAAGSGWEKIAEVGSSILSYTDKVKANVSYKYTVVARDEKFRSDYYSSEVIRFVPTPALLKPVSVAGGVEVRWKNVEGADKYVVYRKGANDKNWSRIAVVSGNSTVSYTDKKITNQYVYTYTVRALNGDYKGSYNADGTQVKYLSAPVMKNIHNLTNGIYVTWKGVSGADGYKLYRRVSGGGWSQIADIKNGKTNEYTDTSVKNGTTYRYTARAYKGNTLSGYESGIYYRYLATPTIGTISNTALGVTVNWKKTEGGKGYIIYRKAASQKGWTRLAVVDGNSKTSYLDKNVKSGTTYKYTVRQYNGDYYSWYTDGKAKLFLSAPTGITANVTPMGTKVSWNKVNGASGYNIYRRLESSESWKMIASIGKQNSPAYVDKNAPAGSVNCYVVRATYGKNCCSGLSNTASVRVIDPKKPMVALTYDDGPYSPVTNHILDVLEQYKCQATFFVVGSRVGDYADCVKRAVSLGCEIGNHTYNHTTLSSASASTISSEISRTNDRVYDVAGVTPKIVRAPGGSVSSYLQNNIDYPLINWSVDTEDWRTRDCSSTVSAIKSDVRDGSIVLMHDLYYSSGDATEIIVPWLIDEGYQIVTVSQMMAAKGITMEAGGLYRSAY